MVKLAVDHLWVLPLLLLCVPAFFGAGAAWHVVSSVDAIPQDAVSRWFDRGLRALSACVVGSIVLGLAGLHTGAQLVTRTGSGAHIVLVLDRSLSMDEGFALAGQKARMTKTEASAELLKLFFAGRPHDSFGLVAFSTQPILAMPLTEHRGAMAAAMTAMAANGLANTDIGAALEMALQIFAQDDPLSARVLLFVSDGAGRITDGVEAHLRTAAMLQRIHLYYLYLRSGDSPALTADASARNDTEEPAALDAFFRSLGVPYRGFEADDPNAVAAATHAIDALETRPVTYHETVPRLDYAGACYGVAAACLFCLLLARLAERDFGAAQL